RRKSSPKENHPRPQAARDRSAAGSQAGILWGDCEGKESVGNTLTAVPGRLVADLYGKLKPCPTFLPAPGPGFAAAPAAPGTPAGEAAQGAGGPGFWDGEGRNGELLGSGVR